MNAPRSVVKDIEHFIVELNNHITSQNSSGIQNLYDKFFAFSEGVMADSKFPTVERANELLQHALSTEPHPVVLAMYSELYYRHLLSKLTSKVTPIDREAAWNNYIRILNYFIDEGADICSISWLWDIFDELLYQLHESQRSRSQPKAGQNGDNFCWTPALLVRYFQWFVQKSDTQDNSDGVNRYSLAYYLARATSGESFTEQEREYMESRHFVLAYFAEVCVLGFQVMMGNYRYALKIAESLEKISYLPFWRNLPCHLTLLYFSSFTRMMLRRYQEAGTLAIPHLSQINLKKTRDGGSHRVFATQHMVEKICWTLLLCTSFSPNRKLEELLERRFGERQTRLVAEDDESWKDAFLKTRPKFIASPAESSSITDEPFQRQLEMFMEETENQRRATSLLSFCKLYRNISLEKLGGFMEVPTPEKMSSIVIAVNQRSKVIASARDVEISLESDSVSVQLPKVRKSYVDAFIHEISRVQELRRRIAAST